MKVELIDIDRVIPYARNPRKNDAAIAKVAASIKEYGFRQPIVVDEEMVIIAGHTRLQAAQTLTLKKVPVHVATGLTQAQIKAYRLADTLQRAFTDAGGKWSTFIIWGKNHFTMGRSDYQRQYEPIGEVLKFGNMFIAVFDGIGRAFSAFADQIVQRFSSLGKDLAAIIEDPFSADSYDFENTGHAFETGLLEAMGKGFDSALEEAKEFNAAIDAEIQDAALKMVEAQKQKAASLGSLFEETATASGVEKTNEQTKKFNKMQQEAQRIIKATRTPLEKYNKQMELLNKLLKEGHINQETFARAADCQLWP